eukprot:m.62050 g.62050  ORF g.62050 m.62050 type:complete len:356 (+) comp11478_c0_seq1:181-1248(+)
MAVMQTICLLVSIGCVSGLQYMSGWGINVGSPLVNSSWVNLQYQVSQEIAIKGALQGIPSLFDFTWTEPDPTKVNPKTGFCESKIKRFGNTTRCKTLRHDYITAWSEAWKSIQPFVANKTYVGVFLGDENIWDGASIQNLSLVTDMIKKDWPTSLIYINEAQDTVNCNFNRLGDPVFHEGECLPDTLDWFGYDYYCTIPGCKDPYGQNAGWNVQQDGFKNMLYPKLTRDSQRVVPTSLGFFYLTNPFNDTMKHTMDEYCTYNAEQYLKWGLTDERVIGMFPFYWPSAGNMIGLSNLTKCRDAWIKIGMEIVRNSSANDEFKGFVGGGQPGLKKSCPSPKDKIKYYWCDKNYVPHS